MQKIKKEYTPGPWAWDDQTYPTHSLMDHEQAVIIRVHDNPNLDGEIIALTSLRDARLIAQAPAMLDAIKWMFELLREATQVKGNSIIIQLTEGNDAEDNYDMLLKIFGEIIAKIDYKENK